MTSQEADFDEDLDFDCFLVTGFLEAVAPSKTFRASSKLSGFSEMGFSFGMSSFYGKLLLLDKILY